MSQLCSPFPLTCRSGLEGPSLCWGWRGVKAAGPAPWDWEPVPLYSGGLLKWRQRGRNEMVSVPSELWSAILLI